MPEQRDRREKYKTLKDLYSDPWMNAKFDELRRFFSQGDKSIEDEYPDLYDNPEAREPRDPGSLPYVPRPSMFQPDPFVVGSGAEASLAKRLLDLDPETKQRTRSITFGPTRGTMMATEERGFPIDDFPDIVGMAPHTGEIAIHPRSRLGDFDPALNAEDTLAHEIAHRAGYRQLGADAAGRAMRGSYERPNKPASGSRFSVMQKMGKKR